VHRPCVLLRGHGFWRGVLGVLDRPERVARGNQSDYFIFTCEVVRTTLLLSNDGEREGVRARGVVRGNDDGGGTDVGTGGGEGCRGGGIDRGEDVRFVMDAFWIVEDRVAIGLAS
jgi:hypothetical protein